MLLVEAVIHGDSVGVRWMRVQRLTLKVIVLPFLIIVFEWNSARRADNILILSLEFLNSFKVLGLVQGNVVDVCQEAWVFLIALMPPNEWIVVVSVALATVYQEVKTPVEVWNVELCTLTQALVRSVLLISGAKASINSILMSSPHISQSVIHILIVASPNEIAWQEEDECNVLYLQLE